jgi:hypothetical protein
MNYCQTVTPAAADLAKASLADYSALGEATSTDNTATLRDACGTAYGAPYYEPSRFFSGGCSNCGYCPHCGRSNTYKPWNYLNYPSYPYMNVGAAPCQAIN